MMFTAVHPMKKKKKPDRLTVGSLKNPKTPRDTLVLLKFFSGAKLASATHRPGHAGHSVDASADPQQIPPNVHCGETGMVAV